MKRLSIAAVLVLILGLQDVSCAVVACNVDADSSHIELNQDNNVSTTRSKEQLPKITEAEKQEALKFLEQNSMQEASIQQRVAKSLTAGLSLGAVCYIVYRFYYYATAASYPEQILTLLQYLYKRTFNHEVHNLN